MGFGPVRLYAIRLMVPAWTIRYRRETAGLYFGTRYWWVDVWRWRLCLIAVGRGV